MIDNECNILSNMSKTEFREFRSLMVEMVLHTGEMVGMVKWWDGRGDCHQHDYLLDHRGGHDTVV